MPHIRAHVFLLAGLVTLALFFVAERLGGLPDPLETVARLLIVPMYVVWLVFTTAEVLILGPEPTAVAGGVWIASLIAGLAPYALLDHLVTRWRGRSHSNRAP